MPIVSVGRDVLFERLGQTYTDEEFDELCFSFGIELDDVTSERQMYFREVSGRADTADDTNNNNNNNNDNNNNNNNNNNKDPESLSDAVIYKVDIPANRYDLLSLEGLVRALRVFLTLDPLPVWTYSNGGEPVESIVVSPSVSKVRPYVVAAVIRGIQFDEDTYNSFLDFQDKLHFTLCRRRTLVAIGTHDLDTVKGPFRYAAVPSREVRFRPLFQDAELTGPELWSLYEKDAKFSQYMRIHCSGDPDADRHPLITDADGVTLSMPPVINGEHSKLTLDTRNVLIECTATDRIKAHHVLNTLVCNFSEYAGEKLTVERVRIVSEDGSFEELVTPDLTPRVISVPAADVRRVIGHNIPTEQMSSLLTRMQLPTEVAAREKDSNNNNNNNNNDNDDDDDDRDLVVTVPALRTDVLHPIDVIEDVAIAFGYNNLVPRVPATVTVGRAQPVSEVTDLLRSELAMAGFTEALTLVLCRRSELFASMRLRDDGSAVTIANPKGIDYETARCSLGPSLLKTVAANKSAALPLRLFEAADVVIADPASDVGARNEKRLCAVFADRTGGFEVIHGLLDRIMETLGVNTKDPALSTSEFKYKKGDRHYEIAPAEHRSFFPSRCAEVRVMDEVIGHFGIVHPEVLAAFGITVPTAMLEIKVTPFI